MTPPSNGRALEKLPDRPLPSGVGGGASVCGGASVGRGVGVGVRAISRPPSPPTSLVNAGCWGLPGQPIAGKRGRRRARARPHCRRHPQWARLGAKLALPSVARRHVACGEGAWVRLGVMMARRDPPIACAVVGRPQLSWPPIDGLDLFCGKKEGLELSIPPCARGR